MLYSIFGLLILTTNVGDGQCCGFSTKILVDAAFGLCPYHRITGLITMSYSIRFNGLQK